MPAGEDHIRSKYFDERRTHPHRRTKKKSGFEGNNWPSTRTFYSDIPLSVVHLSKTFIYYTTLAGLNPRSQRTNLFLEKISRDETGYYVSNYTISGMLNEKWGVRHKPTARSQIAIAKLIEWLKSLCKEMGVYKPFDFKYAKVDLSVETQTQHERKNQKDKEESRSRSRKPKDEVVPRRFDGRESNYIWRLRSPYGRLK